MEQLLRNGWTALIISLPSRSATPRMRVWRALKALGAAVLRDGVYLLPESEPNRRALEEQAREVIGAGGGAYVLRLDGVDPEQARHFCSLFDRTGGYARVTETARKLRSGLEKRKPAASIRTLKRLRREYEAIRATDYFPGPAAGQAEQILTEVAARLSPGEPRAQAGGIARLDIKAYRRRTWVTRARPWVDRLASAWLIRRFIDPKARFLWLKNIKRCPRNALGFDFDGATFTHVGACVTFEVLLESFGLRNDKRLVRLGQLVHYLDVGGVPVAEARGLEMILAGAREQHSDDNVLFVETGKTFDNLYQAYSEE
jgi:hypothetical protein